MDRKLDLTDDSEEELRRSMWYLAQAQRLAHVGYWDRDLDAGRLTLSEESCHIFGLPTQRHVDLTQWHERWLELIDPDDRPKIADAAAVALRGGPPYDVEYRVRRPTGDVRIVRSRAEVTWDESGRPRRMFGVMQDVTEPRRAERELRRSQTYLAEAQRISRTGSFGWDPSRAKITWSDETHRIFGLDPATPPTIALVLERTHPDDRAAAQAAIRRAEEGGAGFDLEHRLLMPDGSVKHLHVVARAVTDEANRREFAGAIMDVTEAKRAEEERRAHVWFLESMDRVHRAVQGTDDLERMTGEVLEAVLAIFECDRAALVADSGEAERPSFGVVAVRARRGSAGSLAPGVAYAIDEDLGVMLRRSRSAGGPVQFTLDSAPPLPAQVVERLGARSILSMPVYARGDAPAGLHHFVLTRSPRPRVWAPHEVRLFHEIGRRLGDALRTLSMLRDLRASELRFRTLLDFAADAFMLHDDSGAIVDANQQACENLGYARDELMGKAVADFDVQLDPAAVRRVKDRVEAGETVTFETRHRRKDGTVFPVEVRARRVLYGDRSFAITLSRDITERKRAEEERERLRQAEADLARISRVTTMGEFTASLAHEIRQPIAAAITNASACIRWLARDHPDVGEARDAAARIVADANRAADIVHRVRSLYKNDAPRHERVDVNDVVLETLALLRGEASRHAVSMRAELAPDLPPAMGDRVQLQQVLVNLIVNGLEATGAAPGVLRIESARGTEGELLVTVSDEGIGLPEGAADKIFDAFFTTKPQGTGMGLAISRSIVERHGGRLWATPAHPRGTSFHLSLPADDPTE